MYVCIICIYIYIYIYVHVAEGLICRDRDIRGPGERLVNPQHICRNSSKPKICDVTLPL